MIPATIQIHPGMTVLGSDGKCLGVVDEVIYHDVSLREVILIVRSGRLFWPERRGLSVDLVDRVDPDAGTIQVCFEKPVFNAMRSRR